MTTPIRIAINGFGRIGRLALRASLSHRDVQVVAINDLTDAATNAHLFKYDSVHGIWPDEVRATRDALRVAGRTIRVLAKKDPQHLPWRKLRIDLVLECTGLFTDKASASAHVTAGAKAVIISAPADNVDRTIVLGVNEKMLSADQTVISNASCTTNSLSPVALVLDRAYGIVRGMMNTVHSYTNDQRILDLPHKDLRRARAAALSIIPTTTGATTATAKTLPALEGRLQGVSLRVPTPCGSITDFVALVKRVPRDAREVNAKLKAASRTFLKNILEYSDLPLVSVDIVGNPHSAIVDSLSTQVNGSLVRVLAWYDNEWGYANRLVELARRFGRLRQTAPRGPQRKGVTKQ